MLPHYSMVWFSLMGLIEAIRVFTGPSWQPLEIGFAGAKPPSQMICDGFPRSRMRAGKNNYVEIGVADLSYPPQKTAGCTDDLTESAKVAHSLRGSLEQLLLSYQGGPLPSISQVAEFAGLSVRSLCKDS